MASWSSDNSSAFLLQPAYDHVRTYAATQDVLFPSLVALGAFHFCCLVHTAHDAYLGREVKTTLLYCALPQFLVHFVVNTLAWIYVPRSPARLPDAAPSVVDFAVQLSLCYVVGDFLIYWEHRTMHKVVFLRHRVHAAHHKYTSPLYSWHAGWVHPVEIVIATGCELAFPLMFSSHPLVVWFFVASWVFWLCEEHSGKDEWWSLSNLLPGIGGGAGG
jgi:sterol desaturase/sphingolipid hydroxylase (fatty acid hydroxylase superfamily)